MQRIRRARPVGAAVFAVVALLSSGWVLAGPTTAGAASHPAGRSTRATSRQVTPPTTVPTGGNISWAVQPATAAGPAGHPSFIYTDIAPGTVLHDYVGITNYSNIPVTFTLYAADAINTPSGGFDALGQKQRSTGVGAWVSLATGAVTVHPDAEANVPFTVSVPQDATPGDHFGGILAQVASAGTSVKGAKFTVDRRVGARVYLRVVGPLRPVLTIRQLSVTYGGTVNPVGTGDATVTYAVANTGNVALAATQSVKVTSLFGTLATTRPAPIVNLVPGQEVHLRTELHGIAPAGPIQAHVTLDPAAPKGTTTTPNAKLVPAPEVVEQSAGTLAIPWTPLALLVLLLALAWLWRFRRKRKGSKLDAAVAAALEQGRREAEAELAASGSSSVPSAASAPSAASGASAGGTGEGQPALADDQPGAGGAG